MNLYTNSVDDFYDLFIIIIDVKTLRVVYLFIFLPHTYKKE